MNELLLNLKSYYPYNYSEIPKEFLNSNNKFKIDNYDGDTNLLKNLYDENDENAFIQLYFSFAIFDGLPNENYDNLIIELTNEPLLINSGETYNISDFINDEQKFILNSNPNYKLIISL